MIALGKGKADSEEEPSSPSMEHSGPEYAFAKEAFSALKDDDEEGFTEAFLGAVKACITAHYDDSDENEEV